MIKNDQIWEYDEAPTALHDLINEIEAVRDSPEELQDGELYAQRFTNSESDFLLIRTGYYLPEWAEQYHLEDKPFREEFSIARYSSSSNGNLNNGTQIYLRYTAEPLEMPAESEAFNTEVVEISESILRKLVDYLKEEEEFFKWQESDHDNPESIGNPETMD